MKRKDFGAPLGALLIVFSCAALGDDSPRFAAATFTTLAVRSRGSALDSREVAGRD